MREISTRLILTAIASAILSACTAETGGGSGPNRAVLWVRDSAEFDALTMQAYRAASDDLPRLIADKSWTAVPGQRNYGQLPPAIIFDVDETLVSGASFQEAFAPPSTNAKRNNWNANNKATPIPGASKFVKLARNQGVDVFFVTNRPCEQIKDVADPCPQEGVTIQDLKEVGIPADSDNVMLANERPDWDR